MKKVDAIFITAIALTAVVSISAVQASQTGQDVTEPIETACQLTTSATTEPTTAAEIEETVEPTQEAPEEVTETEPTETTPSVTLYDVPLDANLQVHIIETAEEYGIDPAIIFAMAERESAYRTDAIGDGGNSYGLLQVQPYWHYERMLKLGCTDLLDPFQNVAVGVDYLAEMLDCHGGDIAKALTAYNAGHFPGYVTEYARDVMVKAEELMVIECKN